MSNSKVRKITASKELQNKVGTGTIDTTKVEEAQKVIAENKVDFAPLAKPHLDALRGAIEDAQKDHSDSAAVLESFSVPIMNLKANAGTFNYQLVSKLTDSVLLFLEGVEKIDKKIIQIIDLLYKTVLLVLAHEMKGEGGKEGEALIKAFQEVCRKYKPA